MADNPNTLPADFFSTKGGGNPDTLPADFFAGRGGGNSGTPSRGGRNAGGGQGNEGAAKLKGNLTTDILGGTAEVAGKAVRGTVRTAGHVAQAMTGNVGPVAQDVGNAVQAQSDQWDKAKSAWNRGQQPGNPNSLADKVEAGGHALAAALPIVGPAAAEAGETIGGEVAYDDPAHPDRATSLVRATLVGRGIGQGIGTILMSSPKNVTGPVLSKTGGALATVADRMGVPEALERSAGVSYRKMLTPTAKGVVTEAEQIAGGPSPKGPTGLVKTRPMALTRKGMMDQAEGTMKDVGPQTSTAYNSKPPLDPRPILDHLEELRQQKAIVKGTTVVADPALNAAIDELAQNIEDMRGGDGKVAAVSLDDFKDKLNRGLVSPKGHMRALSPQTAAAIEKSVAGRIGGYLDTAYPDAAEVNAAYRTAKHTRGFLEEQRTAEIAAQSGVRTGSSSGFGAALKKAIPAPLRGIPNALSALTDSTVWDSVSGATKAKIAELIRNGSWDKQIAPVLKTAQTPLTKQSLEELIRKYTDNTIEHEQSPAGPEWWKQQGATRPEIGQQLADTFTEKNVRKAYPNAGSEFWEGQPPTHAETIQRYRELFDEARARDTQKAPLSSVMERFGVPTKDTPGMHIPRADAEWWRSQPDYATMFDQADKLAARRARTAPTVPESGVPENVSRVVDARERMAKTLTGKTWETASAAERNVIDQMITEGHGMSVTPQRLPPAQGNTLGSRIGGGMTAPQRYRNSGDQQ